MTTAVLLVNLGTPDSPALWDVFRYLNEFLTDGRVIDVPWFWRQLLVRLNIVPRRVGASTALYQRIWSEQGSPLMVHSLALQRKLQERLGDGYVVRLAMRYQNPSIASVMDELRAMKLSRLVVLPMFPQYASATSGSVHQKVMEQLQHWEVIPETHFVTGYATHPLYIEAFAQIGSGFHPSTYDHIVFSFHGLPERQVKKAQGSSYCYRAQCHATADALGIRLGISPENYSITFQSRLGKEPWTQPYTDETLIDLARQGKGRLLVFAPAFTCDCLETIDEIGREYAHQFQAAGGETLTLVPSLNDHPTWVEALVSLVRQ